MKPIQSGIAHDIPGHNSSYKKEILFEYGDALESMMNFEYILHQDLRNRGYKLYIEAAAETYHLFMTEITSSARENFNIGKAFAASRALQAPLRKRAFWALTSPLLPAVRTVRILKAIRKHAWQKELLPGILPWLLWGLAISAAGEFVGYVFGKGEVQKSILDLDFHRQRFVSDVEVRRIWSEHLMDFTTMPVKPNIQK
jgi:hypothetical protein